MLPTIHLYFTDSTPSADEIADLLLDEFHGERLVSGDIRVSFDKTHHVWVYFDDTLVRDLEPDESERIVQLRGGPAQTAIILEFSSNSGTMRSASPLVLEIMSRWNPIAEIEDDWLTWTDNEEEIRSFLDR